MTTPPAPRTGGPPPVSRRRRRLFVLLSLALWLPVIELGSCVATSMLVGRGLMHGPVVRDGFDDYMKRRDPVLGWPAPSILGKDDFDASGSRLVPSFPDPGDACVSFFGDSFTLSAEVSAADSYPNGVAKRLGCRVNNFGVGGYGTDQAVLRYRDVVADRAPHVVLGHYTENIVRNVNQYRDYLVPSGFGFKPRFVPGPGGTLRLIPLPSPTREQYVEIARGHPVGLDHEYFYPGGPAGIVTRRFPYTLAALGLLGQYRVQARLRGQVSYAEFYEPSHPSGALRVTTKIIQTFVEVARSRGQQPWVVLIPDLRDLEQLSRTGHLPFDSLVAALRQAGIEPIPLAERLMESLGGEPPSAIYGEGGHFNPRGYDQVARVVAVALSGEE